MMELYKSNLEFQRMDRIKPRSTMGIDGCLPGIHFSYHRRLTFVGELGFTPKSGAHVQAKPVPMDTGVDWGVGVLGDGRGYLPKASQLEKISEIFWKLWDKAIYFLYIGNEKRTALRLLAAILEMWENLAEEMIIETKRTKLSLVHQLNTGWNCAWIPLPPALLIFSIILAKARKTFSVKIQIVNTFYFIHHIVSVAVTLLCLCAGKAAIENI